MTSQRSSSEYASLVSFVSLRTRSPYEGAPTLGIGSAEPPTLWAMTDGRTRWIFAGQLGPLFDDGGPMMIIEAKSVFGRRPMHRAKAHLYLSAMRHRAA